MMEPCVLMEKTRQPDGLGGWITEWKEGARFQAAIGKDSSTAARQAEKEGVTELYTVTVSRNFPLEFHDAFRRLRDGHVFRVTSNIEDNTSPVFSTIDFGQVSAESWILEQ